MDTTKRQAADRVRHILAAMDRSIDSARRRRLHISDDEPVQRSAVTPAQPVQPSTPQPAQPRVDARDELIAVPQRPNTVDVDDTSSDDQEKPGKARLKARPKRPVGFGSSNGSSFYGAKSA